MSNQVITFGCRLNTYESEVIKDNLMKSGVEGAIVFNTCAVTAEAERQARQAIRRAKRENPDVKIIVTGCSAQVNSEQYSKMAEVDLVIGNEEKLKSESYNLLHGALNTEKAMVNDIMSVKETASHLVSGFEGKARAFVQVQNGCNHRCTFCIIPYGRGNSRSVPIGEISSQINELVKAGYSEVVMTGVDITDYGKDLPASPTLGQMVKRVLALNPELKRLRLSSLDPVEIDDDLYRLIAEEPRLMPHLHISLQAGDDMVLKRMKRRHLRKDIYEMCEKARDLRPDVVFGADIIAGFPTETDEMFENTLNLVKELEIAYLHVFPYSERDGTPAARMPQVEKKIRKERAKILIEQGKKELVKFLATRVGKNEKILIESAGNGKTEHYAPVNIQGFSENDIGKIVDATILGVQNELLMA